MTFKPEEHVEDPWKGAPYEVPFTWAGSVAHYAADFRVDAYVADYCCIESDDYLLVIDWDDYDDWELYRGGELIEHPCPKLIDVVEVIISEDDPEVMRKLNIGCCGYCGAYFKIGDAPHTPIHSARACRV